MDLAIAELPDDVNALKALVLRQYRESEAHQRRLEREKEQMERDLQLQITLLRERLNLLLAQRFGASSEKLSDCQLGLFNEAKAVVAEAPLEKPEPSVTVASQTRTKRGRRPLPESLPWVEVVHDLPDAQKLCPHDGTALEVIGAARSERLDIVPAKVQVLAWLRKTQE